MSTIIDHLLKSNEPSIRWKIRVLVLKENLSRKSMANLEKEIRQSKRVRLLLSERKRDGRIPYHPYAKWYGAHWVLSILADIGYPPGDNTLIPLREQVYDWLLSDHHIRNIKIINGRPRRCGSQEGNAVYSLFKLGLADERTEELAKNLISYQWPDGGWNCDKNPDASHSSFHESLIPLRGLYLYAQSSGHPKAYRSVERVAEFFLQRKLFKRKTDGSIIDDRFLKLHYPSYWHYDLLVGLKVMAETNFIHDDRCREALDYLKSRRLPDGGFPADEKLYNNYPSRVSRFSPVDWGGTGKLKMNEWITVDALYVLRSVGR